jgi:nicotinate-nucleotide adenylyltransferase
MMGGAFDPPHNAHVELARVAIAELGLDELRVVPTGQAWHKTRSLSPGHHRLAMARLAFSGVPRAVVDSCEIEREGPSYTLDTLRQLAEQLAPVQLFLVIGADQARALPSWHGWLKILEIAIICVAERADLAGSTPPFVPPPEHRTRFRTLSLPPMAVSATEIRARVSQEQDIASLVCEPVARYIHEHHLYQIA